MGHPSAAPGVFLTFLVITYRRPAKLARLLGSFLDPRWRGVLADLEIVVADDHGEDDSRTAVLPVLAELRAAGWSVRYAYRERNLRGDRNLYEGYSRDAQGEYVWLLCDDDQLHPERAADFLQNVRETRPALAICGFSQGEGGRFGTDLGREPRVIRESAEAVRVITNFPKTSAYVLRRAPAPRFDSLFERWDKTLFAWIGLSIVLFSEDPAAGVFVQPEVVASADEDFGELPYGFRIFRHLHGVSADAVERSGLGRLESLDALRDSVEQDELVLCLRGLQAHYNPLSHISYTPKVLDEERAYLRRNAHRALASGRRFVALLKLLFRYCESLIHPAD